MLSAGGCHLKKKRGFLSSEPGCSSWGRYLRYFFGIYGMVGKVTYIYVGGKIS